MLSIDNVNLVFEGLDTYARISVNGKRVGVSQNMFSRYVFDVKDNIKVNILLN